MHDVEGNDSERSGTGDSGTRVGGAVSGHSWTGGSDTAVGCTGSGHSCTGSSGTDVSCAGSGRSCTGGCGGWLVLRPSSTIRTAGTQQCARKPRAMDWILVAIVGTGVGCDGLGSSCTGGSGTDVGWDVSAQGAQAPALAVLPRGIPAQGAQAPAWAVLAQGILTRGPLALASAVPARGILAQGAQAPASAVLVVPSQRRCLCDDMSGVGQAWDAWMAGSWQPWLH